MRFPCAELSDGTVFKGIIYCSLSWGNDHIVDFLPIEGFSNCFNYPICLALRLFNGIHNNY